MAKKSNQTRQKAEENIIQGAVASNVVDLLTLKRMYPKRFIADIVREEGYEEVSYNKYRKK